jgi:hypothetical protein
VSEGYFRPQTGQEQNVILISEWQIIISAHSGMSFELRVNHLSKFIGYGPEDQMGTFYERKTRGPKSHDNIL